MSLKDFVKRMLERHGYDGLFDPDTGCNCSLDELMVCGEPHPWCEPGILVVCSCEDHDGHHFEPKRADVPEQEKFLYLSQQPLHYVDATPDEKYPLRILRTYLENSQITIEERGGRKSEFIRLLNETNRKRVEILEKALLVLEKYYLKPPLGDEGRKGDE